MKNFRNLVVVGLLLSGLLAACGGGAVETAVDTPTGAPRLTADYNDALPVQSQLAVGTLQLEDTDLAVDETLAADLLPLWQALQSLDSSETTAEVEITAVLNQIQNTMQPEQIGAIADMQLTQESMTVLIEDGTLTLGRGGFGSNNAADSASSGGFTPPGGIPGGGGFGGGPGGGIPGGGFGGGQEQANLSEDDIATRQAARESGGSGGFQNMALTGAVIRLLETKTGVVTEQPADPFAPVWGVLTEATGLTIEEIQAQTAAGKTLAEIIEASGGDVAAVTTDLIAALQDSPIAQRQDVETYVTNMLTNVTPGGSPDNNN
jgi:hypothetical protein